MYPNIPYHYAEESSRMQETEDVRVIGQDNRQLQAK